MSGSQSSFTQVHDSLYDEYLEKMVVHTPEALKTVMSELLRAPYGAYICQKSSDPRLHDGSKIYSPVEIGAMLEETRIALAKDDFAPYCNGVIMYIATVSHDRMQNQNTPVVAASVIKYYYTILAMRMAARVKLANDPAYPLSTTSPDDISDDDELNMLYWENIQARDIQALKVIGTDLYYMDGNKHTSVVERIDHLLHTPAYLKYGTFLYSKSFGREISSVTWLIHRARSLLKFVADKDGIEPELFEQVNTAIKIYAPSMKTSTTGCELDSDTALFIPKDVEASRLVHNLFAHHLRFSLCKSFQTILERCVYCLPEYESANDKRQSKTENRQRGSTGGGRK